MRIFVVTKKTIVTAAIIMAFVIIAVILAFTMFDGNAAVATTADAESMEGFTIETVTGAPGEYELTVLAGKKKELPVYCVKRDDKKIALTIDAAWEADKTPFILETLEKYDIKATFFLCGFWVDKYPEYVKAIYDSGNELGNHSATHPHMSKLSVEQMKKDVMDFETKIKAITGQGTKIFRAPYGEYNDEVIRTVRGLGFEVLQWDVDTVDWKEERSAATILETVFSKLKPGSIILSHNNGFKLKEYLPPLIERAQADGYEFVTISELLLDGETVIDVNGMQSKK